MPDTVYDVTTFPASVSPFVDIGTVINEIIADIKATQNAPATRPGAVIYIPPGHYDLRTRVVIDISFLQIKGSGHGFMSQAIRDGSNSTQFLENQPGGSHVRVLNSDGHDEAFLVTRPGNPVVQGRLNAVEFRDFCINGVSAQKPYVPGNRRIGISVQSDNDSFVVAGMGFCYLRTAVIIRGADALAITNNFIAECGTCVELVGASIVGKITDNFLISAWGGSALYIENANGHLISGNTILWNSRVHLNNVIRTSISSNRFVSHWPGMIRFEGECHENLIVANHFDRTDVETADGTNGHDDLFGMVHLRGNHNAITSNLFTYHVAPTLVRPPGVDPTIILVAAGNDNYLASNHIVSTIEPRVVLDASTTGTKVIHSATAQQLVTNGAPHSFVPTP